MPLPCRAILIYPVLALVLALTPSLAAADTESGTYHYDARMAFLNAGALALELHRFGNEYEVSGEFQTSRTMSSYYTWNGIFAATGRWEGHGPVTTAYMSRTVSKDDDLKIVLTYDDSAHVLDGPDNDFEVIKKPGGIDLISALFFSPSCYKGGLVHDGEDTYQLNLRSEKQKVLKSGSNYYSGEVVNCDYSVVDHKQRKRRIVVSLAEIAGSTVAVQVRAKIPIFPDAYFRLRLPFETHTNLRTAQVAASPAL